MTQVFPQERQTSSFVNLRARRDLVTNPAYVELMDVLKEMVRMETVSLTQTAKGTDQARTNFQAGVLEGIDRTMVRMDNYRDDSVKEFTKDQTGDR